MRGHDDGLLPIEAERVPAAPEVAAWMDMGMGDSLFHCVCLHPASRYRLSRRLPAMGKQALA